nr:MAG TPA: hypothetical protein [Caudoviricetes sp.]
MQILYKKSIYKLPYNIYNVITNYYTFIFLMYMYSKFTLHLKEV